MPMLRSDMNTSLPVAILRSQWRPQVPNEMYREGIEHSGVDGVTRSARRHGETVKRCVEFGEGGNADVGTSEIEKVDHLY